MSRGGGGEAGREKRTERGTGTNFGQSDLYLGSQDCAVKGAGRSLVQKVKLQRPQRGWKQSTRYNNKHNRSLLHNVLIELCSPPSTRSQLSFILPGFS